jgi:hypothetical protein
VSLPGTSLLRRRKLHAGAASLRQANGNRLLGGTRAMLSFTDVVYLLADEFPSLRARRLALTGISTCAFDRSFFWH